MASSTTVLPPTTMEEMIELVATEVCIFKWLDMKHIDTVTIVVRNRYIYKPIKQSVVSHKKTTKQASFSTGLG